MTAVAAGPLSWSAGTRLLTVLGDPVAHSLSPRFQNAALHAMGLDAVYLALRCSAGSLSCLLQAIARAGGAGNVSVPHKERAARVVDARTAAVERTGACNTFWLEDGRIHGDNTDVFGFASAVETLLGQVPRGARVLLLGAGGAARAAVCALADAGADEVVVLSRTRARALALADIAGSKLIVRPVDQEGDLTGERFDLVVNATPLGLDQDDPLPLDSGTGITICAALDLVYRPGGTPWVRHIATHGVPVADGSEMLLQQGAAAFRRWWGSEPPMAVMRDALTAALHLSR